MIRFVILFHPITGNKQINIIIIPFRNFNFTQMKAFSILTCFIFMITGKLVAQDSSKTTYPLVVSFQSICCGVPSDKPVIDFINVFKKKNKIQRITASHIGPMGKEGEYYLAFSLRELSKKQAKLFIAKIKTINKLPDESGILTIRDSMEINAAEIPRRATIKKVIF